MPAFIHIVARENSNPFRDLITGPTSDASIRDAFDYVERGDLGGRSRTPLNGRWAGVPAIARNADGTADVQRMWMLTDAQMQSSAITTPAALQAFAQRLADDVHQQLRAYASRNRGGAIGDFWTVTFAATQGANAPPMPGVGPSPVAPGAPPPQQQAPTGNGGTFAVVGLILVGLGIAFVATRKD
jgi:hypothetical protein